MRELKDRVVVVTGGASGIGKAMAARLHAAGSKVVLADQSSRVEAWRR